MSPPRLVVALEPDEDSLSLVEGYARLAAELRRELVALLLDDPGFGIAMALPFARLQPRTVAQAELGPSGARRALEVLRARIEGRLGEVGRRLEVRWQVSVAGSLPQPAQGDILVLGIRSPRQDLPRAACPVVLRRRTGRSVVVLYEGTPDTLTLGAAVARREGLPATVLTWAADAVMAERLAAEAAAVFGADYVASMPGVAAEDPASAPLARLAALRPRAVVVDACNASVRLGAIMAVLGKPAASA